ncbi:MAG: bifunctional riboflavin kinase/FAD synthetase [Bdellovibrionaceae bacterium]|nr:bifunctional riboflavin kinase/FAD synthetase [Pseudobdellovibrionaceae bacterium]NUM59242.1 bifunctional riboflavin kinase/FAD synthetase [Pseudobdellovibrionaceae bacterium]
MHIFNSLDTLNYNLGPIALTIGNFDGVHLGHKQLVSELCKDSTLKSLIISFEPHPIKFFRPEINFKKLFCYKDQIEQLEKMKVDYFVQLSFNKVFSQLKYDDFLEMIERKLDIKKIVIGYDFRFGKDKGGTYDQLKNWCEKKKIELIKIEEIKLNQLTVSTTEIKKQLDKSDMLMVTNLLGRHFYVEGVVVKGDQRGRLIGFPTANLQQSEETHLPHLGVYATRVKLRGQFFNSVTNIGRTPTFKQDERVKVESHLLDFNQDIYGEIIQIEFRSYLRAEKKFNSLDELKTQIQIDINERRKM